MSVVRVAFLGTPEFAVTCLNFLLNDEHYKVVGVVTQPDRPSGRKLQLRPTPVKEYLMSRAQAPEGAGLPVISPENINNKVILQEIESWGAELAVVVAFGQILGEDFLKLFPLGAVNLHGSILPELRGAAPIQRALEQGFNETGVSLQKVVKKLDAGDVLGVRKVAVLPEDDAFTLYTKLALLGTELLHVELMDYARGNLTGVKQDESKVTYAKKIEKAEALISWLKPRAEIFNKIRAFAAGPVAYTEFRGKKIKVYKTRLLDLDDMPQTLKTLGDKKPGEILLIESKRLIVICGDHLPLEILELQPESRARLLSSQFLAGMEFKQGECFG